MTVCAIIGEIIGEKIKHPVEQVNGVHIQNALKPSAEPEKSLVERLLHTTSVWGRTKNAVKEDGFSVDLRMKNIGGNFAVEAVIAVLKWNIEKLTELDLRCAECCKFRNVYMVSRTRIVIKVDARVINMMVLL